MLDTAGVMISLSEAFGETPSPEDEKVKLTQDELISLGCQLVPFDLSCIDSIPKELFQKNVILLMKANSSTSILESTDKVSGEDQYEEDGTAGAYETSGNCARVTFDPNFVRRDISPFIVINDEPHFPLDALEIYSGGYATCSCYQPEEAATFNDYEETREVVNAILRNNRIDPVKSFMTGTPVAEEETPGRNPDGSRVATDTVIENAVLEFAFDIIGHVLVVPSEMIPPEKNDDSGHLTDRLTEFDAFEDLVKVDEPSPESKD